MLPFGAPPALATTVLRSVAIRSVVAHPGENNDFAYGSGATIRNGVILTAAHVISEGAVETSVSCATAEGFRTVPARTVILDRLRDVGFLEASDCTAPEMRISTAPVRRTEPLITVGFHFGSDGRGNMAAVQEVFPTSLVPLVTLGEHRDESNDQEDAPEAQRSMSEEHKKMVDECRKKGIPLPFAVSGALIPGKSGSPVVSVDGSLVGMVVMTAMSHNRSFIVPTANILHVMRQAGL
jgi:S1-C subfamily serine protease